MTPVGWPSEPKIGKVPPCKSSLPKIKYQSSTLAEGLFMSNTRCSKIRQKATEIKMNEIILCKQYKPYFCFFLVTH